MKQHYIVISIFLLLLFSSNLFPQGNISVELEDLSTADSRVNIAYKMKISAASIASGQGVCITPMLRANDSLRVLSQVIVLGSNKAKVINRWAENNKQNFTQLFIPAEIETDTVLYFKLQIPHVSWMDSAQFSFNQEMLSYRGQSTVASYILSQQGSLSSSHQSEKRIPKVSFITPPKENKFRNLKGRAFIDFPVGQSNISPNYGRNGEEYPRIKNLLGKFRGGKDISLQRLYITGYASPEGDFKANAILAEKRALALKNYIKKEFGIEENLFSIKTIPEDWDGLSSLVLDSDIPEKEEIANIISTVGIFHGREKALMDINNGTAYQRMLREMFPKLRRVEYCIDYKVKDYDINEIRKALDNNPEDLSQLELYSLGMAYGGKSDEFKKIILDVIPRYFPNDAIANNNVAAILIMNGELLAARRYLEQSGETAAGLNNLGAILMLQGDLEKAIEYFKQAQKLGNKDATDNLIGLQTDIKE